MGLAVVIADLGCLRIGTTGHERRGMSVLVAIAAGIVSGLHAATWGAYKDAPYEGLRWASLLRSPVVATVAAILLWILIPALREAGLVVFVGGVYTAERLSGEGWRCEDGRGWHRQGG